MSNRAHVGFCAVRPSRCIGHRLQLRCTFELIFFIAACPSRRCPCVGSPIQPTADQLQVQVCDTVDILIVATKPQVVAPVLSENANALKNTLVVSIAAGKTLQNLIDALGNDKARVIRVMPNTPCMVGASAAAMCTGVRLH